MKRLIAVLLFGFLVSQAQAQDIHKTPFPVRPRVNVDLEISLPGGDYGDLFGVGFGGSGGLDIPITRALYATGSAGVMSFYRKNSSTRTYIPMKAGAKYYLSRMLYAQTEIGTSVGIQQGAGVTFIFAPGVGISYPITKRSSINGGLRFESWSREGGNINQLGIKVGYQF
ncbi:outer membrane beta-barrel protein [Arcticibacter eurypsychrophilus]|uniref:outer membrane beta-barrel protein n=1 Tax=Arcticibacter eurypsychrophilus TaxID=1434752 RepID=UPI00084DB88A|nr:hypothetical protein [Arcticibacter eurypsychrophilus]